MLDLNSLGPTGRLLYARSLAGALAAGVSPLQAEAVAKDALVKAGHIMKSAEPTRVMKRLEVVKAEPGPNDMISEERLQAQRFLELFRARRSANPKVSPGEIHSQLAREFPQLAHAYRVTG